jgi:transcriptional regulator GlxA family with amidase domain
MSEFLSPGAQRFGFLLADRFALMSFASATEPLRAANLIARASLYAVQPLSVGGRPVVSSAGLAVPAGDIAREASGCHTVFVIAGGNPEDWKTARAAYPVLRRLAREGVRLGGISSGSYLLAEAGLLDGRDFTIHWEHAPALKEAFPALSPRPARFVIDVDRITCGGGIAPLDMMHALIADRMGAAFARRVSDWYLHTAVAEPEGPQRGSAAERHGTRHPALLAALETMETALERPLSRTDVARTAGISIRHLDRLFRTELGRGFAEAYRAMRLEQARKLIEQSPLSISEIAFATGFSSASHFARAYKEMFGLQPKAGRGSNAR